MEKTFKELIKEKFGLLFDKQEKEEIIELMHKVRAATIEECKEIAMDDDIVIVGDIIVRFDKLPTDRIKVKDECQ